jgi:hypothetical protein
MQTHEQMRQEMINLRKQAKNMPYDRVLVAGRKILRMPINRYWYELIAEAERIVKLCNLQNVSQQRELLRAYNTDLQHKYDFCNGLSDIDIDNFLGSEE